MVFPLWSAAPESAGGLGYSSRQIGQVMALTGLLIIVTQVREIPRGPLRTAAECCGWERLAAHYTLQPNVAGGAAAHRHHMAAAQSVLGVRYSSILFDTRTARLLSSTPITHESIGLTGSSFVIRSTVHASSGSAQSVPPR